ncbi:MAG: hypothetical protein ACPG1C_09435 [Alphaproteobacteria bacterium]
MTVLPDGTASGCQSNGLFRTVDPECLARIESDQTSCADRKQLADNLSFIQDVLEESKFRAA